jgi:surface antigen
MATPFRRWLGLMTLWLIAAPVMSGVGDGYNVLRRMPAGHMDERDLSLLQDAVVGVLEDESAKATRSWNNSKNGHSGKVTSLRVFQTAEGRPCKKVQIDNAAKGTKSSMRYDVCLHPDGNWREAESGVLFGKATRHEDSP